MRVILIRINNFINLYYPVFDFTAIFMVIQVKIADFIIVVIFITFIEIIIANVVTTFMVFVIMIAVIVRVGLLHYLSIDLAFICY